MNLQGGKLIVIDGIDGSGKSTQIELLKKYLQEKNILFEIINFPRYGENIYADLVTRYLEGKFGSISDVNPYLMALAFAGDRLLAKPLIENWLVEGKMVIANRYVSSSKAHLSANLDEGKRESFMEWIDRLEYQTNGMPKPNLTILLNVDPRVGQKNALDNNSPDMHEESLKHLEKARKNYLELSQANPDSIGAEENWVVLDCMENNKMKPPQRIHQDLLNILE